MIQQINRKIQQVRHDECGQALPLFAIMIVTLLGFMAFSIDTGRLYYQKNELQNVADIAAMAAAHEMMADGYPLAALGILYDGVPEGLVASVQTDVVPAVMTNEQVSVTNMDYTNQDLSVIALTDTSSGNTVHDGIYDPTQPGSGYNDYEQYEHYKKQRITTDVVSDYAEQNGVKNADVAVTAKYRGNQGSVTVVIKVVEAATLGQLLTDADPTIEVKSIVKVDRVVTTDGNGHITSVEITPTIVTTDPIV